MVDLYTLFTRQDYQERIFTRGFPKEYTNVGPVNNRVSKRTEAGELPSVGGHHRPTERQLYHSEELRGFYRTLGEDHGLTSERAGQDLQRSIAMGLCHHTKHFPKPCLSCIALAEPLVKPFGRALKHAAMFERKNREVGYVAMGQGLDVLEREVTQ